MNMFLRRYIGLFYPDIELFASRINEQLKNNISWFPDPYALTSDACSIDWSKFKPYICPPYSLVTEIGRGRSE